MKRPRSHATGDAAERIIEGILPKHWIFRRLPRDYGVDVEVEMVDGDVVTGARVWFQVKGTTKLRRARKAPFSVIHSPHAKHTIPLPPPEPCITFKIETDWISYALRCDFPLLLIVVDETNEDGYWLPIRDYIEMVVDVENPFWRSQRSITVDMPFQNSLKSEKNRGFDGFQWYSREPARMRAFSILSGYAQFSLGRCNELRAFVSGTTATPPAAEVAIREISIADAYFSRALEMECLFGARGVDWFELTRKPQIQSALEACRHASTAFITGRFDLDRLRATAGWIVSQLDSLSNFSLCYEACRRRFLFSTEREMTRHLQRDKPL